MKSIEALTPADFIGIIRRRLLYLIVTTVLFAVGATIYVYRMPRVYKSETTIMLSSRLVPEGLIGSLERATTGDKIEFVRQQLESRTFLSRIVTEFQFANPTDTVAFEQALASVQSAKEFTALTSSSFKLSYKSTDPNLAQAVTRRLAEAVMQMNDDTRKEKSQAADQFIEEQVRQSTNDLTTAETNLIEFKNKNFPGLIPGDDSAEGLRSLHSELTTLDTRWQTAASEARAITVELQELKPVPGSAAAPKPSTSIAARKQSPLEIALANKKLELEAAQLDFTPMYPDVIRLKREVERLDARVKEEQEKNKSENSEAAPADSGKPSESSASVALDSTTSDPRRAGQAEMKSRLDELNKEVARLDQERKQLAGRIAVSQSWLNPKPELAQQLAVLNGNLDYAKQASKFLAEKKLNSQMASKVDSNDENGTFKVVDPAYLPQAAISPNRSLLVVGGCLAGLVLGLGAAIGRDFLDSSLHNENDASAQFKLPIMAAIPALDQKKTKRWLPGRRSAELPGSVPEVVAIEAPQDLLDGVFSVAVADSKVRDVILDPFSLAGEPYRLINAKLWLMQRQTGLKSILISSAIPGEGKTFTACCLAGVLAREPRSRVLLIDADLRTGSASEALGIKGSNVLGLKGLLEARRFHTRPNNAQDDAEDDAQSDGGLLVETDYLGQSVIKCDELNLYFLPSGTTKESPSQLFNAADLERVIRQAEGEYDWVIIDSPPILALSDANLLAPICGATLLVIGSGMTGANLVRDAIQRVGPERVCGLLMNRLRTPSVKYYSAYSRPLR